MTGILSLDQVFSFVGGRTFFLTLVDRFYSKIEKDLILRPIFPTSLEEGKRWQFLFLIQLFGGPKDYETVRGPAALRRKHLPFKIGLRERNRWVGLMMDTLDELGIKDNHPARPIMQSYFEKTATKMINVDAGLEIVKKSEDILT